MPGHGQKVRLFTHVHVREDALALFGFATEAEQHMFELLIGVNGVGPKVALQVCSSFSPGCAEEGPRDGRRRGISAVPGIGKKTAQRIVLDLKEKMQLPDLEIVGSGRDTLTKARSALENLGYSAGEARVALAEVGAPEADNVEDVVRSALKVLA